MSIEMIYIYGYIFIGLATLYLMGGMMTEKPNITSWSILFFYSIHLWLTAFLWPILYIIILIYFVLVAPYCLLSFGYDKHNSTKTLN